MAAGEKRVWPPVALQSDAQRRPGVFIPTIPPFPTPPGLCHLVDRRTASAEAEASFVVRRPQDRGLPSPTPRATSLRRLQQRRATVGAELFKQRRLIGLG